jgi:hypothetical protein
MRIALEPASHRVPRTKTLLHTWRPHRQRTFALVLHLHQHQSSHSLHLQYLAKNQSTPCCQSLITPGSDHPLVPRPHLALKDQVVRWFEGKIKGLHARGEVSSKLFTLAQGPNPRPRTLNKCHINNWLFRTVNIEKTLVTQNSGVLIKGEKEGMN